MLKKMLIMMLVLPITMLATEGLTDCTTDHNTDHNAFSVEDLESLHRSIEEMEKLLQLAEFALEKIIIDFSATSITSDNSRSSLKVVTDKYYCSGRNEK